MADLNTTAFRIVREATEGKYRETVQQANGRAGGLKGGKIRAAKLTPARRSEIARNAARARWALKTPR